MIEKVVSRKVNDVFFELKSLLSASGCKLIGEKPPTYIAVTHGSLWSIRPKNLKKNIKFYLSACNSTTRISAISSLSEAIIVVTILFWPMFIASMVMYEGMIARIEEEAYQWYTPEEVRSRYLLIVNILELLLYVMVCLGVIDTVANVLGYLKVDALAEEILKAL